MTSIFKYKLASHITESKLRLPKGAEFVSLAVQHNEPVAYFRVDEHAGGEQDIDVFACATGGFCPPTFYLFMGTAMLEGGNYVLHFYYHKPK